VLLLDTDTIVLRSIDHVFERSAREGASLVYTSDYAMSGPPSHVGAPPVQGGFLLIAPDADVYRELVGPRESISRSSDPCVCAACPARAHRDDWPPASRWQVGIVRQGDFREDGTAWARHLTRTVTPPHRTCHTRCVGPARTPWVACWWQAGSRIGWCWGGRTIQGLLAYYYNRRATRAHPIIASPTPDSMIPVSAEFAPCCV